MIVFAFFLSLFIFYFQCILYGSSLPILPFIPWLAFLSLLCPLLRTLFLSFAAGLFLDSISTDPFGIHALNYTLTAALCYRWRSRFSPDNPLQLCLYTALCSFVSTQLQIALLFLFDRRILFGGKWWATEWAFLPIFDALYALVWFAGPLALFRIMRRTWMVYWLKKKNPSPN